MALLLLSLVVAGVMPLLTTGDQAYQEGWRRQEMVRNAQVALDRIARDFVRAATVHQASGGTLRFDVVTETGFETVEYSIGADGDLTYRTGGNAPQPLAGPFASFRIDCFGAAGQDVSCNNTALVRQVGLTLEAADPRPDPLRGPVPELQVRTRVARRVP
ncbi:MAG: hypothetical protein ACK45F_09900 [bacterium]